MRYSKLCLFLGVAFAFLLLTASSATASPIVNVSGTVRWVVSTGRFVFQTGFPRGYVPVVYSQSMVVPAGSTIRVGDAPSVTGTFDSRGQLFATQVSLGSSSTGRYHIATYAYDSYWADGQHASAADVNQLVTYAQGNAKSLADCHSGARACKAIAYFNPNHVFDPSSSSCVYHPDADVLAAASESWFIHQAGYADAAHRVHGRSLAGCTIWQLNPGSPAVQAWWSSFLRNNFDAYDLYFEDSNMMDVVDMAYFPGSGGGCNPWPTLCRTSQEIPDNAALVLAHTRFVNAMNHVNGSPMQFLFQQASFNIALDMSAFVTNRHIGLSCEGCIATHAITVRPNLYKGVLDEMAAVNASSGSYLLISHGAFPAGSPLQILQRLVTTGVVWLAYSEGHTMVQPDLESNTTNLAVWPEDLVYPSAPLQSMVLGANDLQVAPGVYRREFASCYQRGVAIGPCATVVNSTGSLVYIRSAWLQQTYGHVVTLAGGDVLSGGVANKSGATFTPNQTSVQAGGALLLAR